MFAVCRPYGLDRCEPNVTFTLLSISYQPPLVDDPVPAARTVRRGGTDYTWLAEIRRNRHPYPTRVLTSASGLPAAAECELVALAWRRRGTDGAPRP